VKLHNTLNGQIHNIYTTFQVAHVLFDPDYNIIAKCNAQRTATVGTEAQNDFIDLIIFPNPARDRITIRLLDSDNTFKNVDVTDMLGGNLAHFEVKGLTQHEFPIDFLQSGAYLLNIQTKKGTRIERFLKL
jgi:Secretion system C-terminal sorting domain